MRKAPHRTRTFDPIDLEILWNRLIAVVDEAAYAVLRTSMSKVVVEARDFAAMLYDPQGRLLASDVSVASKTSTLSIVVRELLKRFPASSLLPGDVLISNNPWWLNGHLNDVAVVAPIFFGKKLVGFAECYAHMPDVGGNISGDPRDLFEEGLVIPPMKLIDRGKENASFVEILQANVRIPRQITGDLHALVAGAQVMQNRACDFLKQHKLPDLAGLGAAILDASERAVKRGIAASIPDGEYHGATTIDALDRSLDIKVRITSRKGKLDLDFAGSSPQVPIGINSTPVYTAAYALYAIKCIAAPYVPSNEGTFAPVQVHAPEGTILNPRFPAPVRMKPVVGHYVPIAVFDALKDVVPQNMIAESGNKTLVDVMGADAGGRQFHDVMFLCGGMAARATKDGLNTRSFPANTSSLPTEILEAIVPVRVRHRRLRTDSGGAGRYRGGCGQSFEFESVSSEPVNVMCKHGKLITRPAGYRGGSAGAAGGNALNGTSVPDKLPLVLEPGDVLTLEVPGSGGMYPAFERDPEAVRRDVEDELVTLEAARDEYGVVINPHTLEVDVHATADRRGRGAA